MRQVTRGLYKLLTSSLKYEPIMPYEIVKEILALKSKNISKLLSLTESPIEKIFLAQFLHYVEWSVSTGIVSHHRSEISGSRSLFEVDVDEVNFTVNDALIGIELVYAEALHLVRSKAPNDSKLSPHANDFTKRQNKMLQVEGNPNVGTLVQKLQVIPQYKVQIENDHFRLDFAFLLFENSNHDYQLIKKIAVECDGHEFHSDKKSFTKDRERYRKLALDNWILFPFSGSEINHNNSSSKEYYFNEFNKIYKTLGFGASANL